MTKRKLKLRKRLQSTEKRPKQRKSLSIDPLSNKHRIKDIAVSRLVTLPSGKERNLLTFSKNELAELMDTSYMSIDRWVAKGQIPAPVLVCGKKTYWCINEALAILEPVGKHLRTSSYYTTNDISVRDSISRRVSTVRATTH